MTALPADSVVPAKVDTSSSVASGDLWTPVVKELQAKDGVSDIAQQSIFYIFCMGFLGGLLALFTPCVWPIIPMTVSFFLKRNKDKSKGLRDAITYGISIVVIYVALGLVITSIFGASRLNDLATNDDIQHRVLCAFSCICTVFLNWFERQLKR